MKIIGVGDLVCDLYYQDGKMIGVDGGKSFANIAVNLADQFPTYIWGACGLDFYGDIALKSLEELGVETKYIMRYPVSTRLFHIDYEKKKTTKKDFKTNEKTWYSISLTSPKIEDILEKEDVLILDSFSYPNLSIFKNTSCKKMVDLGYFKELDSMSDEEIYELFNTPIAVLNMNERVEKYLLHRFHKIDFLNVDLFIITYGKKGAKFMWNNHSLFLPLIHQEKEIDTNGLGDLFFSQFIAYYLKHDRVTEEGLKKTFEEATKKTSFLASKIGARGHLHALYRNQEK